MRAPTFLLLALVASNSAGATTGGSTDVPDALPSDLASPDGQVDPVLDAVAEEGLQDATDPKCERSTLARFTRDIADFGAGPIVLEVASERPFIPWW
jgi:hypothetical protein